MISRAPELVSLGLVALLSLAPAAVVSPAEPQAVCQKGIFANSCGPCSIYNSMAFGNPALRAITAALPGTSAEDKVRGLILLYGARPSFDHPDKPRFSPTSIEGGINAKDETQFFDDILHDHQLPPVKFERLGVSAGESPEEQLRRVHDILAHSIAAGLPPVLSLATFVPSGAKILRPGQPDKPVPDDADKSAPDKPVPDKSGDASPSNSPSSGGPVTPALPTQNWQRLSGHDVCVVGISDLEADAPGFSIRVANSQTGQVSGAYIYSNATQRRPYVLHLRPDPNPFLQILGLGEPPIGWNTRSLRTVMAATHW